MRIAWFALLLASAAWSSDPTPLQDIAANSLRANIVELPSGVYLSAGAHQFHTLWTRDFCFSIPGLLVLGRSDVVKSHLTALIENRRESDSLIPRVMDQTSPQLRTIAEVFFKLTGIQAVIPLKDPLKAQYLDDHGSEAIDSNLLLLLGALDYFEATHDQTWWNANEEALVGVFHYYDTRLDASVGLISQPPFSDWQDSVRREGITFYTNLLYTIALKRLAAYPHFGIPAERWRERRAVLDRVFFDSSSGLYRSMQGQPYFSLDGNLLAIDWGLFDDDPARAAKLYQSLLASPFWSEEQRLPGFDTFPGYPKFWRSDAVRWVGLSHYHDRIYWSWLIALSAKVALDQGDRTEATRIARVLQGLLVRDASVAEIYKPTSGLPIWQSLFFRAEIPFSWGAAKVIELGDQLQRAGISL